MLEQAQESKEVLLDKLICIQVAEASKQIEEMDTDLIVECTDYIIELTGDELPTEDVMEQMKQNLLRRLFGSPALSMRRYKGLLRKLLIAAVVAILIASISLSMMPLGTNDESLHQRWGYFFFKKDPGDSVEFENYLTMIKGGKVEEYATIRQFIRKTGMDILVPAKLPDGYKVQKVQVHYDYVFDCPFVTFVTNDPLSTVVNVYIGREESDLKLRERNEKIGEYFCAFSFSSISCQCEFNYDGNGYVIVAKEYEDARLIVENMKGSIKQ